MSLFFVLIFYGIALSVAAAGSAIVLFAATRYLLRFVPGADRRRASRAAALLPFSCVTYAAVWFAAYALINVIVLNRDPGLGDGWNTPLPNGYALEMIDVTDEGTVYNPKTQPHDGGFISRDDTVFGARQLQVAGPLIFGARDSHYFQNIGRNSNAVDSYFELNTATNTHLEFATLAELNAAAAQAKVTLRLKPFAVVFGKFRWTWFDGAALAFLFAVPALAVSLLGWWIVHLRNLVPMSERT